MKTTAWVLPLAGCLLMLAGCDLHRKLESQAHELASPMGRAVAREVDGDDGALHLELVVESRQEATWAEAQAAIAMDLPFPCPDGQDYRHLEWTPAMPGQTGALVSHPAGTTFLQRIRCDGPFPGERPLPAGSDAGEAVKALLEEVSRESSADAHPTAAYTIYQDDHPKYKALKASLGNALGDAMWRCAGGGVIVEQVRVADIPRGGDDTRAARAERGRVVVAVTTRCAPDVSDPAS